MASTTPRRPALASTLSLALSLALSTTTASAQMIPTATAKVPMNALTYKGCFSTAAPLVDHGPYTFQSSGNCQPICYQLRMPVMGLVNGTDCYCGSLLPPAANKVDDGRCNTPCNGFNKEMCTCARSKRGDGNN